MSRPLRREPAKRPCFLCEHVFLAEWARFAKEAPWHASEICPACEGRLREKAADKAA